MANDLPDRGRTGSQDQTRQQTNQQQPPANRNRQAQQSRQQPEFADPPGREAVEIAQRAQENARSAFKAGQATITPGKAGELSLAYKWIDLSFPGYDSARFDVTSAAPNAIEVRMEQDLYKKMYTGTGAVATAPVPRAPTGTQGKMIARDTATGETIEVPWFWYDKNGGSSFSLWQMIKRLIWKGDSS
jgi:hypothetical protein